MRLDPTIHRARPWRVHDLARDFTLLDAWRIPIEADPARGDTFADFYRVFVANGVETGSRVANALFRLRFFLGRALGLDRRAAPLPIPGCTETSVAERLTAEDRAANRARDVPAPAQPVDITYVYLFDTEALIEISNRTIHGLLHLGWVDGEAGGKTVEMAVYVKSRGRMSDGYMALIGPFRHLFVYPPWIRRICRRWDERPRRAG
jgi:hypothetical protein